MRDLLEKQIVADAINGDTTVLAELLTLIKDEDIFSALSDKEQELVMKPLTYDTETNMLSYDTKEVAEILLADDNSMGDGAMAMVENIASFMYGYHGGDNIDITIKNDDEKLGVIVDVWNTENEALINTACFWFDDY